ncbi:hypothetical protein QJ856_gp0512 [Tupanvirus deep ocean]|uniref:Uncharacterized protein n=2 Tax=Tupanvirus TaxID=2094720 RepID=A0AC62A981_9VIRU|nr:hypothetical protein QJ856_gp0512 [Tupanvirus deep ocean]QKU34233.1 hypothetical protein [Tupanvirus deep ocean]
MSNLYKSSIKKMIVHNPSKPKISAKSKMSTKSKISAPVKPLDKNSSSSEKKSNPSTNQVQTESDENKSVKKTCAAIRSNDEPQFRCLMKTKNGEKYCPMHLVQKNIIDFNFVEDDILDFDQRILEPSKIITNDVIRILSLDNLNKSKTTNNKIEPKKNTNITMHEQKVSTIENSMKENEDELEIKLLILANDEEYCDVISKLIGPVFDDITLSEDEQDPVTFDEIWTMKDGIKTAASVNKYYLFSYKDSKDKIRCLTIFTIYSMINENNLIHPVTMEEIPEKDVKRAKKLIDLYQTKLGLFKEDDSNLSPEFKLRNRLTKLFKQFHVHSIYLEENWLLNLDDKSKLYKIIKETEKLVSNNIKTINPTLHGFKVFQKKEPVKKYNKGSKLPNPKIDDDDNIFNLQEYIVGEWEKLIQAADTPQNQIPIWILASGLSFVVPEVKQKYPDLEIML